MKTPGTDKWRYRREPRPYHPDEVGLSALAAAIVQQAVEDYREADDEIMFKGETESIVDDEGEILNTGSPIAIDLRTN